MSHHLLDCFCYMYICRYSGANTCEKPIMQDSNDIYNIRSNAATYLKRKKITENRKDTNEHPTNF